MTSSLFKVVTPVMITDAIFVSSTIAETDYAAWSGATTYASGAYVISTTTHRIYVSLQAGNLNHDPTNSANSAWWSDTGPTNRWGMLDDSVGTYSTATTSFTLVIQPGRIDTIALLGVDAASARIQMSTVADGTFYDVTTTLTGAGDLVMDWYGYFYAPISVQSTLIANGLPAISDASITITLTRTGGTVSCGMLVVGLSSYLGQSQHGAKAGIVDFSRKETDAFGRPTLVQRRFAKTMQVSMMLERSRVEATARTLAALRATPALWIAHEATLDVLIVYGFYKDFDVGINYHDVAACNLTIEGIA